MTAALPSGPRGRVLALGLTAAVLGALWVAAVAPLIDLYAARAETLAGRRELASRMERLVAALPGLRAAAGAASPARALIEGETDAIAGAALQGRMQEMAGAAGATLSSAESLPTEAVGAYRRVALRVALTGTWPVLVELLRRIEEAPQGLLVDDLRLQAAPSLESGAGRPLSAAFTVQALRAAPASPAARAVP